MTGISAEPASTGANLRSCCARARSWPTAIGSSASSWTRAPTPAGAPLSPGSREVRRAGGAGAGGPPELIRNTLVGDFRGVEYKPIEFHVAGHNRRAAVPGLFTFEVDGVLSRNRRGEPLY